MKIAILIYVSVSLFLGGLAATFEVWSRPSALERVDDATIDAIARARRFVETCQTQSSLADAWREVLLIGAIL